MKFKLAIATKERAMSDGVYKVIEIIGASKESWEDAARTANKRASKTPVICASPKSCDKTS